MILLLRSSTSRSIGIASALISVFVLGVGCSTNPKMKRTALRTKTVRITAVRDPLIRSEIREELNDLKSLAEARRALRDSFRKDPLKGPLALARLEDVLVAEYRANALQKTYLEEGQKRPETANSLTPLPSIEKPSLDQSKPKQVERHAKKPEREASFSERHLLSGGEASRLARSRSPSVPTSMAGLPSTASSSTSASSSSIPGTVRPSGIPSSASRPMLEPGLGLRAVPEPPATVLKKLSALENSGVQLSPSSETPLIFDIPVTYNARVSFWIRYFQTEGRLSFRTWLERSARFLPIIQYELTRAGLPQDLVYVAMIESGFSPSAVSHASAMGLWQFISPTGRRYGLRIDWWLDERKDFLKSTRAAISYMTDLYRQFSSWYLVAASYNMGENGVRRLIKKYGTNNFWELADRGALPKETKNYVPKIIAAMLISKAPALYGFRDLDYQMPLAFEYYLVPGGTDLDNLARYLGVSEKYLKDLNPELIKGFVPRHVSGHKIRIPKGSMMTVSQYVRLQTGEEAAN